MTARRPDAAREPGAKLGGLFAVLLALSPGAAHAGDAPVEVLVEGEGRVPTEPLRDPTAAAFVLEAERLDRPGQSAADVLATVPGVEVTRSGGGADLATASLRGATSAQTPIHLAGVRLNDDLTGTADLSGLPLWMLRRIEVDRGTAPTSADRLGLGGAVFFEPLVPERPLARLSLGGGSFGQREVRGAVALGNRRAAATLAIRHEMARDDFEFLDDRGTRFDPSDDVLAPRVNADHVQTDVWAIGRWDQGDGRVRAVASAVVRDAGAPGLQLVPARRARAASRRGLAGVSGEQACAGGRCRVEWAVDGLVTRYHLDDPERELGGARSVDNAGERSRQRVRVRHPLSSNVELTVGIAQEFQRLEVVADGSLRLARRHLLHGDVEGRVALGGRATLLAAVALDCHSTASDAGFVPCGIFGPSARLGARVSLAPGVDAFANASRALREPTLGELFGISSALRGNASLRPETGHGFDVGIAGRGRHGAATGYLQVDAFARWSADLIAFRRSSFGAVRPYNVGSSRVLGAEVAAGGSLWRWLQGSLALTWLDPRDTSAERTTASDLLPFRSRFVVAPALELRAPSWSAVGLDGAGVALRYLHRSARVADPAGLLVLPALGQLDLELDARLGKHAAVRARLANLLDQRTVDLLGYPLPGRAGYANVEWRW